MACVLDAFRGEDRKDKDIPIADVPDEVYQCWVDQIESISPNQRKRWKTKLDRSDGSSQPVRCETKWFYAIYINHRIFCASVSDCNRLREMKPATTHVQYEEVFLHGLPIVL